jgi:putative DNA primase/helicase
MTYVSAQDIHRQIGANGWPQILVSLGVGENYLRKKPGPCPACGGEDRFTFDNRTGHGDYFCRRCEPGDGFKLLMRVHGWQFSEARQRVMEAAGLTIERATERIQPARAPDAPVPAKPTRRVERLIRERCLIEDCEPAIAYLKSRALWPLPKGHSWRAHPSVGYWNGRELIGRYAALVAVVRDLKGEPVTAHVTYLTDTGRKLDYADPRKILSPMTNRSGCAARLMQPTDTLGVAEGIETAFSAARIHRMPVWACLNTSLLQKFEPPAMVKRLVIFADRDEGGLEAAGKLMERIQGRIRLELKVPQMGDWNDVLRSRHDG